MPIAMQAGLLRALENGEIRRVGDTKARNVDVRLISATNRDLSEMVKAGSFRADLMYRLDAAKVRIPPLRERSDDIVPLAHHLLGREASRSKKRVLGFAPEALLSLLAYSFPGNVRGRRNEIARAVALTPSDAHVIPSAFSEKIAPRTGSAPSNPGTALTLKDCVEMAERHAVELALARNKGNLTQTAKELGLSRAGFYKVLVRLGLRQADRGEPE
jgi:transcriptional regulator with PAS, ATPase and Fis domain